MRTPAFAIAWAIWCQNRMGLLICAVALLVMAVLYPIFFSYTRGQAAVLGSILLLVPVYGFVMNSLLVVDEFGSLSSGSPRHRFSFPVRTRTLVFWPMLYGWLAMTLLWLLTAWLIYRPSGFATPIFLPALGMAALMSCVQAISWLPPISHWVRLLGTLIVLGALAALPIWLISSGVTSAAVVTALLFVYITSAYLVSLTAVESDRRGDVWRVWPGSHSADRRGNTSISSARRRPFKSAAAAQLWYEWRCHGMVFPAMIAFTLVSISGILVHVAMTASHEANPALFPTILTLFLFMAPLMAGSVGPALGRLTSPFWVKPRAGVTFLAIRPIASEGVVAAKFRMAILSVLLTLAINVSVMAMWLATVGRSLGLTKQAAAFFRPYLDQHGFALIALVGVMLPALTWKHLTGGFVWSLTGRRWIGDTGIWIYTIWMGGLVVAVVLFLNQPHHLGRSKSIVPYLVVGGAILKGVVAVVAFRWAFRRHLIGWSSVGTAVGIWMSFTACGCLIAMIVSPPSRLPVSMPLLYLGIAAFMPLCRFPLATLAFDWNRHR